MPHTGRWCDAVSTSTSIGSEARVDSSVRSHRGACFCGRTLPGHWQWPRAGLGQGLHPYRTHRDLADRPWYGHESCIRYTLREFLAWAAAREDVELVLQPREPGA